MLPALPIAAFACETVLDEIAEKLGIDSLAIRELNSAVEGDWRAFAPPFTRIGALECVQAAQASAHWNTPLVKEGADGKRRGRGVASGYWGNWDGVSSAIGRLNPDGTVSLLEGSTDIGGSRASIAMMFAEAFGVEYAQVHPSVVDTDTVDYNDVTGAVARRSGRATRSTNSRRRCRAKSWRNSRRYGRFPPTR